MKPAPPSKPRGVAAPILSTADGGGGASAHCQGRDVPRVAGRVIWMTLGTVTVGAPPKVGVSMKPTVQKAQVCEAPWPRRLPLQAPLHHRLPSAPSHRRVAQRPASQQPSYAVAELHSASNCTPIKNQPGHRIPGKEPVDHGGVHLLLITAGNTTSLLFQLPTKNVSPPIPDPPLTQLH
jgi:hypothetical protein